MCTLSNIGLTFSVPNVVRTVLVPLLVHVMLAFRSIVVNEMSSEIHDSLTIVIVRRAAAFSFCTRGIWIAVHTHVNDFPCMGSQTLLLSLHWISKVSGVANSNFKVNGYSHHQPPAISNTSCTAFPFFTSSIIHFQPSLYFIGEI